MIVNKVVCIRMVQLDRECEYRLDLRKVLCYFFYKRKTPIRLFVSIKEVKMAMTKGGVEC